MSSSGEPKALDFSNAPSPARPAAPAPASAAEGPKPLFSDPPSTAPAVSPARAASLAQDGPKPLSFDTPAPQSARPPAEPGRTLFGVGDHPAIPCAIALAKQQFPDLYAQDGAVIDRHLRTLLPFSLSVVSVWGDSELLVQSALARDCGAAIKRLSELRVPEFLETVLASTRPNPGIWAKLTQRASPLEHRPTLVSTRAQLSHVMSDTDKTLSSVASARRKLAALLAALNAAAGVTGQAKDAVLDDVIERRRNLLTRALQQSDLLTPQLEEVRRQCADLSAQISQLLTVTLPAIELAQSRK